MMRLTTLVYLERGDEYLMLHRVKKEKDINRDKWIGLGGGFEAGESPEDCMIREVYEESGLRILSHRFRGIVTFVTDRYPTEYMHLYTADRWEGELSNCDEGELAFIGKSELRRLPIWEGDRIFLDLLEADAPFFSLKLCYEGDRLVQAVLDGRELVLPYVEREGVK